MPPKKPSAKATPKREGAARATPVKRAPKEPETAPAALPLEAVVQSEVPEDAPVEATEGTSRYWEGVGRRKTAIARARLFTRGEKGIWVNEHTFAEYFPYPKHQKIASEAIDTMNTEDRFHVTVHVRGGGVSAQAEAVRHATARALLLFNSEFRKRLKRAGFLTRDPRAKERKKFGLKKARRAPQWGKR